METSLILFCFHHCEHAVKFSDLWRMKHEILVVTFVKFQNDEYTLIFLDVQMCIRTDTVT